MAGLPEPGTELGPCLPSCEHRDCAETRRQAAAECCYCQAAIGYEVRFVVDGGPDRNQMAHIVCLFDAVSGTEERIG